MMLASMTIMGPAFGGTATGNRLVAAFFGLFLPQSIVSNLFFFALAGGLLALILFDLRSAKRIEPVTMWGVGVSVAGVLAVQTVVATALGPAFVNWLA